MEQLNENKSSNDFTWRFREKKRIVPGGGILDGFGVFLGELFVILYVSIVFIVDGDIIDGGGDDTLDDSSGGDLDADILLFSVNCTGNTRLRGTSEGRVIDADVIVAVIVVVVVAVDVEELVHGDGINFRVAVGGRSKSIVTLSTLFGLVEKTVTGSVTRTFSDGALVDTKSVDIERRAASGGISERSS